MKELTDGYQGTGLQAKERPGWRRGCTGTLEEQLPGEGRHAQRRDNRSQAGLVFEGWGDNCGFYRKRRITGVFPDFLEPMVITCQLLIARALQGMHKTLAGAR